MLSFRLASRAAAGLWLLTACSYSSPTTQQPAASAPAAAPPPRPDSATPASMAAADAVNYAGHYAEPDTAACPIWVTITRQGNGYTYTTAKAQGTLKIEQDGGRTLLTFQGWEMAEPGQRGQGTQANYVSGEYEAGRIVMQNYGNAMNEFTMLVDCGLKYLTLEKVL